MYIPDKKWDNLNIVCCDLAEQLEAMPQDIFFACKEEAISLCHAIMNMQDKPKGPDWTSFKITEPPLERTLLISSKDGIYIRGVSFLYQIEGTPTPIAEIEFTHWMELPSNPN